MSGIGDEWEFGPGVTYLNHGSFGPSPRPVLEARLQWMRDLQANPMDFFTVRLPGLLEKAAAEVAKFVNAPPDNIALVSNATVGMNVVAANVPLKEGDEVLLNDHEYGAVVRIWGQACQAVGAKTVLARLPFPLESKAAIVDSLFEKVTPRTKLIVVSHVTSPTATIFPVQEICERARAAGILVCVDGPHAPAMIPVNLKLINCDFYAASCHKWLCAPFGTGFLYVKSRLKQGLKANVISWGRNLDGSPASWKDDFLWPGTDDPTALLSIPAAIAFFKSYGLERFRTETHALAGFARTTMQTELGGIPYTPDDVEWYGSMAAVELPVKLDATTPPHQKHPLQRWLREQHGIEIPVVRWREKTLLRVSCHLYNSQTEIERLTLAVREWMKQQ